MSSISQMAVMAAIVATMLYPVVAIVLGLLLDLFGIPLDSVVTFGGVINTYGGMLAWWLIAFALALVYAAFVFPWTQTQGLRQGEK